jgi:hypothetical protein
MKLTNPTNEELNAAFAEYVAGWMWRPERGGAWFLKSKDDDPYKWARITDATGADIGISGLRFATEANAILPWLEYGREVGQRVTMEMGFTRWHIRIHRKNPDGLYPLIDESPWGDAETFPRAACIALLRANGVIVHFTP